MIKTDVLGRMRTSAARRESLLQEFDQSGLSGKKFAGLTGIKYQTLATWLQKRRRQAQVAVKPPGTVNLLEAVVEQAAGRGRVERASRSRPGGGSSRDHPKARARAT